MNTREQAVAPCGIDCFHCEMYGDNMNDRMKAMAATIQKIDISEVVPCKGCREQKGCIIHPQCDTLDCITAKKHTFCYECSDFPCNCLHPAADRAERLPHNLKVYNLCRIKNIGLKKWIESESTESRLRYYKGTIVIGAGPQL